MVLVQLPAGGTVISQGATLTENDCMYLLASGEVDIVIAGGGDQGSRNEDRMVSHRSEKCRFFPFYQDIAEV